MRIVLFGKNGQLGWELQRILPSLGEVVALDYEDLDLADLKTLETRLREVKPQLIVNASAYTAVDRAESERELAVKINGEAVRVMAESAQRSRATLIHYSTDYVFDGMKKSAYVESDPVHPINVYGESKLTGERAVEQCAESYLILRTSWVYSLRMQGGFVNKVLEWSRQKETLRIVEDQIGCPTWARMLANVTSLAIARGGDDFYEYIQSARGIYHVAGKGSASRLEWAKAILRYDSRPDERRVKTVEGALSDEFPTPARRPLFSVMGGSKFEKAFGLRIPAWEESLRLAMGE